MMNPGGAPEFDGHELVSFFADEKTGLRGFIAVHNTNLGPATGGTRSAHYASDEEALRDVLRLSRAMTYKCALAGIPYGGGKAVIIKDPKKGKSPALLRTYAAKVNLFGGNFYTGEDAGMAAADIRYLMRYSGFVNGRKGQAGDLAPWTAVGVLEALRAAAAAKFQKRSFAGMKIGIKGLGKIGTEICRRVYREGAEVWAADPNPRAVRKARKAFPRIKIVRHEAMHGIPLDIYSPNALGGDLTARRAREIKAPLICGGANNQLADRSVARILHRRGILYVPDYLANAGGLIAIMAEVDPGGFDKNKVTRRIMRIGKTAERVIRMSSRSGMPAAFVADRLAEKIFLRAHSFDMLK